MFGQIVSLFLLYCGICQVICSYQITTLLKSENGYNYIYLDGDWKLTINTYSLSSTPQFYNVDYQFIDNGKSDIDIMSYNMVDNQNIKFAQAISSTMPDLFGKQFTILFAGSVYSPGQSCIRREIILSYFTLIDAYFRLITGNTSYIDYANSYIPKYCIVCENECKNSNDANRAGFMRDILNDIDPNIKNTNYSLTIFHTDLSGSAYVTSKGTLQNFINKLSNNLLFRSNAFPSDTTEGNVGNLFKGIGVNIGFDVGSKINVVNSGFLKNANFYTGASDTSNALGTGSQWYHAPAPGQFIRYINNVYQPWFKYVDEGKNIYRLLAWDHPYSRIYLGFDNKYDNNNMIGGVMSKNMKMSILVNYSKTNLNSVLPNTQNVISLDYRYYGTGLESYQNKGVKVSLAISLDQNGNNRLQMYSIAIHTLNDEIGADNQWDTSTLPLGYLKVPDVNIGTLKIKVVKFHPILNPNYVNEPNVNLFNDNKNDITLDKIPYVDVEVEYSPNVPYTKPTTQVSKADFDYSPNLFNCNLNDESASTCDTYVKYFWIYMKSGNYRSTVPRLYKRSNNLIPNGRIGYMYYPSSAIDEVKFTYGNMDKELIRSYIFKMNKLVDTNSFSLDFLHNCEMLYKLNVEDDFQYLYNRDRYDYVYYSDLELDSNSEMIVTDIFNNVVPTKFNNGDGYFPIPVMNSQGYTDLIFTLKKQNKVVSQKYLTRVGRNVNTRVAFENSNGVILASPAVLTNKYTCTSIYGPINIESNNWYMYIFINFDINDYIFFDFDGTMPNDVIITIETENGEFTQNLNYVNGLNDITVKINIVDIAVQTGGWGEIYRFKFNKAVSLSSIRPVLNTNLCQTPFAFERYHTFKISNLDFVFNCSSSSSYNFEEFSTTFNGINMKFTSHNESVVYNK